MTSAELLRRRAERLATPALLATVSSLELMVFAVGAARYAVPLGIVRSVLTEAVTPIPGAQAWVAGFINVRRARLLAACCCSRHVTVWSAGHSSRCRSCNAHPALSCERRCRFRRG